ncbi:ribbon-helix-helix domain-containing protein [Inquilinus sp. CA228]|uniref:ribbon-helix-helix domain-containing protein n=1 Tax=Inquilinus sp. CA228 TaxID=3455609 RepID=UPI003F8D2AB1
MSICRNVTVAGRRTSVRMEVVFWDGLMEICARADRSERDLHPDRRRPQGQRPDRGAAGLRPVLFP